MIQISRRSIRIEVLMLLAITVAAMLVWFRPQTSHAYSWSSDTYYLENHNHGGGGTGHYSYRTTQFSWLSWSGNLVPLSQVSFSARIPSTGWAYFGWNMAGYPSASSGGYAIRSSVDLEPSFAMDINNGWVSRVQYSFGDLLVASGGEGQVSTFLCESSYDCVSNASDSLPFWYGAMVQGKIYHNGTTGFFSGSNYP